MERSKNEKERGRMELGTAANRLPARSTGTPPIHNNFCPGRGRQAPPSQSARKRFKTLLKAALSALWGKVYTSDSSRSTENRFYLELPLNNDAPDRNGRNVLPRGSPKPSARTRSPQTNQVSEPLASLLKVWRRLSPIHSFQSTIKAIQYCNA